MSITHPPSILVEMNSWTVLKCFYPHIYTHRRGEGWWGVGGPCPQATVINSDLTRTICVQTGEIPDPSAAGGGGEPGEAEGGICARGLTKISPSFFLPFFLHRSDKLRGLKSEPTEVAWLSGLSPLFAGLPPYSLHSETASAQPPSQAIRAADATVDGELKVSPH